MILISSVLKEIKKEPTSQLQFNKKPKQLILRYPAIILPLGATASIAELQEADFLAELSWAFLGNFIRYVIRLCHLLQLYKLYQWLHEVSRVRAFGGYSFFIVHCAGLLSYIRFSVIPRLLLTPENMKLLRQLFFSFLFFLFQAVLLKKRKGIQ